MHVYVYVYVSMYVYVFIADFAELDIGCIPLVCFFVCFLEEKVIQVWFDYQPNLDHCNIFEKSFCFDHVLPHLRREREKARAREREVLRRVGLYPEGRRERKRKSERESSERGRKREQKRESKSEGASDREREDVLRGDRRKEHGKHSYAEAPAMAIQAWELLYLYMHKRMRNRLLVQLGVSLG
jgi:hypothetical protein